MRRFYWIVGRSGWSIGRKPLFRREGPFEDFMVTIGPLREDQV